jgi:hypothetical protein
MTGDESVVFSDGENSDGFRMTCISRQLVIYSKQLNLLSVTEYTQLFHVITSVFCNYLRNFRVSLSYLCTDLCMYLCTGPNIYHRCRSGKL